MISKLSNFSGPTTNIFKYTTPSTGDSIRAALSLTTQTRYDAATAGNFITVSSAEYASVVTAVSATKYIMGDTDLTSSFSGWTPGFNISYSDTTKSEGAIPTSNYIIGYAFSGGFAANTNITTYLRTGTASNSTHVKMGDNVVFQPGLGNKTLYFIRKAPSTLTTQKTYVSFYMTGNNLGQVSGKSNYPVYYSNFINTNSWTLFTGGYPAFQVIATPTKLW